MTDPRYQDIPASAIPEVTDDDGTRVRVICGEFWGKRGPVEGVAADPSYLDISVAPGQRKRLKIETTRNAFAYVFAGSGTFRDSSEPRAVLTESGSRSRRRARLRRQQSLAGALRSRRRDRRPGRRRGNSLPAGLGQADRGAGRVVRPDRNEHAGADSARRWPNCKPATSSSIAKHREALARIARGCTSALIRITILIAIAS